MKIQCGECEKLYNFNTENITAKGVSFNCKQCDNKFTINDSLVLTSTCGKSKIACSNCGKLLHEDIRKCDHCNVKVNKVHEELRIDNNYYEHLNLDDKGTITGDHPKKRKKAVVFCSLGLLCIAAVAAGYFYYEKGGTIPGIDVFRKAEPGGGDKASAGESRAQVVILKNGNTLYAKSVAKNGTFYTVQGSNGMTMEIKIDDVLQISEAVINQ